MAIWGNQLMGLVNLLCRFGIMEMPSAAVGTCKCILGQSNYIESSVWYMSQQLLVSLWTLRVDQKWISQNAFWSSSNLQLHPWSLKLHGVQCEAAVPIIRCQPMGPERCQPVGLVNFPCQFGSMVMRSSAVGTCNCILGQLKYIGSSVTQLS